MKKVRNFLLACILLFYNSCQQSQVETVANIAVADAAAGFEAFSLLMETCPLCAANTPVTLAVSAVFGAANSKQSGIKNKANYSYGKLSNVNLPANRLINNNPFEIVGAKHNKILNYMNFRPNSDEYLNKIKTYDKTTWEQTLKDAYPEKTAPEIQEIYTLAKEQNILNKLNPAKYESLKTLKDLINLLQSSNFSQIMKTKLENIFYEVDRISREANNLDKTITFINAEILKIMNAKGIYSQEESRVLVLLSTYKHSAYYWQK
jgi:hypothetical protein